MHPSQLNVLMLKYYALVSLHEIQPVNVANGFYPAQFTGIWPG
jgi:hypothetical protein